MWFTEDPVPPMLLLGVAAIILIGVWSSRQRAIWLVGAALCLGAAVGVYFVERSIVTDRERVMEKLFQLVGAFSRHDRVATLSFISRQAPELRELASKALELVGVEGDVSIKEISIAVYNEDSQADSVFRANGTFIYLGNPPTYFLSRWRLRWQKEEDGWKVVEVQRLSIFDDKELGPFDVQR